MIREVVLICCSHLCIHEVLLQGWYSLFPLSNATTNTNLVGWTALVGGTLFEAGAYAMVVEALNRGHTVRFGYEVQHSEATQITPC